MLVWLDMLDNHFTNLCRPATQHLQELTSNQQHIRMLTRIHMHGMYNQIPTCLSLYVCIYKSSNYDVY